MRRLGARNLCERFEAAVLGRRKGGHGPISLGLAFLQIPRCRDWVRHRFDVPDMKWAGGSATEQAARDKVQ